MAYFILTIMVAAGIPAWLFGLRYARTRHSHENFFLWLFARFRNLFGSGPVPEPIRARVRRDLTIGERVLLFLLSGGFGTAAGTGILFALLSSRGIFGLPLIIHVISGGIFSASLAAGILVWVRHFVSNEKESEESTAPLLRNKILIFWVFCISGLILISSAWAMMLPVFPFRAQIFLFSLHRYAALVSTASVMLGIYNLLPASRSN